MKCCSKLLTLITVQRDRGNMLQDPILNYGMSHSDGFFATDCSTLHPLGEVVLHGNDVFIAVMGRFEWTN